MAYQHFPLPAKVVEWSDSEAAYAYAIVRPKGKFNPKRPRSYPKTWTVDNTRVRLSLRLSTVQEEVLNYNTRALKKGWSTWAVSFIDPELNDRLALIRSVTAELGERGNRVKLDVWPSRRFSSAGVSDGVQAMLQLDLGFRDIPEELTTKKAITEFAIEQLTEALERLKAPKAKGRKAVAA